MLTIWALIPLITCLTYIALLVLTLPSIERRINKLFAFYLAVAALWSFTSFMLHFNVFPEQALFWNELLVVALVWTLITYYHFIRVYVNKPARVRIALGYSLVLALAILSFKGYIVQSAYVVDGVLYHDLGISIYFIGVVSYVFIGVGLYLLIKKYRSSTDPIERNRTMYLIAGWSVLMLLSSTNLIMSPSIAGIPLDHIGSLANALIISYAIQKYQLLDLKRVVQKGLVYSSLTVFFTALYLLLIFVLQTFFQNIMGYSSLALVAVLALIVAVVFNPLRSLIQRWIDRLFYRETYDYRQILPSFSGKISNVLDLSQLAQSILKPIVKAMHVKKALLLLPEVTSKDFNTRFVEQASQEEPMPKLKLINDSPLISWLASDGKSLRRESIGTIPQLKGLWAVERLALDSLELELCCPIRSKGNLVGILALGKKQSDSTYSDEEIDLLMAMANEAAIALENARMLDTLKVQQLRVEQLLAQAVLAQEEERKRISADLHDSVAQWLVAAAYGAQTCNHVLAGNGNDKVRDELAGVEGIISKSLKELRRVVIGLRPPALDELGLTHALRQSVEDLQADGLECTFSQVGVPLRLPSSIEIAVYRVVQESLNNIRKHAEASRVSLLLRFQEDELQVEISDDGKGFDLSQTLDSAVSVGHIGLLGMKQRAEMLGGDVSIKTGARTGSTIILSLPIHSRIEEE
ncbi:MAG: GAF domain-containing protein [Chloroflexi bacterium]|nr:GAF domain-containing protein [Chloroflexota bacterium]